MSTALCQDATGTTLRTTHSHTPGRLNPEVWDVQPPPLIVEAEDLEIGQVDTFFPERGFGFIEYAKGRIFFHASGFRMPRMMPTFRNRVPCQEIQLALVRTRQDEEEKERRKKAGEKSSHIILPTIQRGLGMMFQVGEHSSRPQASKWCLQETYKSLLDEQRQKHEVELDCWQRLGRYKLELCERRQTSQFRADNTSKTHVPETRVVRTLLFEGTNTEFLKGWFRSCVEGYRLSAKDAPNPERYVELQFQLITSEGAGSYSDWETVESTTMHDFLGQ